MGGGGADRPGAQASVLDHLGVPDADLGAGRAVDGDAQPAGEVLAEVEQVGVVADAGHGDRGERLDAARRRAGRGDQFAGPLLTHHDRTPVHREHPGVVALAVVDAGAQDLPVGPGPGPVGDDPLDAAVGVVQFELGEQRGVAPVTLADPVPAVLAAPPAVGEPAGDRVRARNQ